MALYAVKREALARHTATVLLTQMHLLTSFRAPRLNHGALTFNAILTTLSTYSKGTSGMFEYETPGRRDDRVLTFYARSEETSRTQHVLTERFAVRAKRPGGSERTYNEMFM